MEEEDAIINEIDQNFGSAVPDDQRNQVPFQELEKLDLGRLQDLDRPLEDNLARYLGWNYPPQQQQQQQMTALQLIVATSAGSTLAVSNHTHNLQINENLSASSNPPSSPNHLWFFSLT